MITIGHAYQVKRPDGSGFTMLVSKLRGRWIYGRTSGGYVGALRSDNVREPGDPTGPFFTFSPRQPL